MEPATKRSCQQRLFGHHSEVAQRPSSVQSRPVLLREMQEAGSNGRSLILSRQTFKKCPFYAGPFRTRKIY